MVFTVSLAYKNVKGCPQGEDILSDAAYNQSVRVYLMHS